MLAYAPQPDRQRLSPTALTLIVAGHIAAIGAVMSAKMVIERRADPPIIIIPTHIPTPPDPVDQRRHDTKPRTSTLDQPHPIVPPLDPVGPAVQTDPHPLPPLGETIGTGTGPVGPTFPLDPPIIHTGPHLATSADMLRPPYPSSKREAGDEASLRLKLTIDARGRVIAVDPVGRVDATFFEAARRHILRAWRYQPAMEGSTAVSSVTTITIRFELGNA